MTKTEVVGVTVKKDERPHEIYAIAKAVSYQNIDNLVEGRFILGFTDKAMAVLVASSISTSAGLPPVTEMGESGLGHPGRIHQYHYG